MQVAYGIGSYRRSDLPQIKLVNLFVESVPEVPGNAVLLPRPALQPHEMVGNGPCRGLFHQDGVLNDALFSLSGQTLYIGTTALGPVAGTERVAMTAADIYLLVATGDALFRSDGVTLTQVGFPDGAGVQDVAYLGGYAIAARKDSRHLYFTLDSGAWDGLDYVSAEQSTAYIVGIKVVIDQLWVFCTDHTEIFYLSGDSDAPIQRVQGRVFDKGCRSRDTIVKLDNTAFWVGNDSIVYRGENAPVRVSEHGIEELIGASVNVTAFAFSWVGHLFYVLQLDAGTFAYDVATKQWHQLESYDRDRWRVNSVVRVGLDYIAGDDGTGQLWKLTPDVYTDDGAPISCEFTVLENSPGFIDNVSVDCSTGTLPSPDAEPGRLEMRTSRDGGKTWLAWRRCPLGVQGKTRTRAVFRRVGLVDQGNMVLHFRLTDTVPLRVSYVRINDALGGRSR